LLLIPDVIGLGMLMARFYGAWSAVRFGIHERSLAALRVRFLPSPGHDLPNRNDVRVGLL